MNAVYREVCKSSDVALIPKGSEGTELQDVFERACGGKERLFRSACRRFFRSEKYKNKTLYVFLQRHAEIVSGAAKELAEYGPPIEQLKPQTPARESEPRCIGNVIGQVKP